MIPDAVSAAINRPLTADELRRELERPITPDERDDVRSLVRWFTRRYPSAEARLAYVRRAYARWQPARGTAPQRSRAPGRGI